MEQVTLRQLLKDPIYKAWFTRPVEKNLKIVASSPEWWVYFQAEEGGKWARVEFKSWKKAFRFVKEHLKEYHDMSITNKRREFPPPVVKTGHNQRRFWPRLPAGHRWCGYCRRPTLWRYYRRHHAFGAKQIVPYVKRCRICGISASGARDYYGGKS